MYATRRPEWLRWHLAGSAHSPVDGQEIPISDYPRFDNPYATVEFDSLLHQIEYDGMSLLLDFEQGLREMK